MRFFLDHDVDAGVGHRLRTMGHEAWSASDAGLATDGDDNLTIYATNHGCVLLTHDKEFSARRRKNVVGRHVHLRCPEPDAADILAERLDELLPILEAHTDLFVAVWGGGVDFSWNWT